MAATMHLTRGGLETYAASILAIVATMAATYLSSASAEPILKKIKLKGSTPRRGSPVFSCRPWGWGFFSTGLWSFSSRLVSYPALSPVSDQDAPRLCLALSAGGPDRP